MRSRTLRAVSGPVPVRARRHITGISAVLLPYSDRSTIDWAAFEAHVGRTIVAGLTPAVNMDTGYVQLLTAEEREYALDLTAKITDGAFVAGAYVQDGPGAPYDHDAHVRAGEAVAARGGTPVIFPSYGLNTLDDDGWVTALARIGGALDRYIGFELGAMFVPHGRIVSLDAYRGMMEIPSCIGAKHSSLSRAAEWERLALRDAVRPDFAVFTGNDLAIDMVTYGSDYLLGLATFAPDVFAARDRLWEAGDPDFYACNDVLQYLGQFAFRPPVPAYRHDAALFLALRGWAASDATPAGAPRRPDSDRAVLEEIVARLAQWT
jgi:dihydrodipicolinate synthase/N-acetylneuraminate lyase